MSEKTLAFVLSGEEQLAVRCMQDAVEAAEEVHAASDHENDPGVLIDRTADGRTVLAIIARALRAARPETGGRVSDRGAIIARINFLAPAITDDGLSRLLQLAEAIAAQHPRPLDEQSLAEEQRARELPAVVVSPLASEPAEQREQKAKMWDALHADYEASIAGKMACGHKIADLIYGVADTTGLPPVLKCGACLAARQEARVKRFGPTVAAEAPRATEQTERPGAEDPVRIELHQFPHGWCARTEGSLYSLPMRASERPWRWSTREEAVAALPGLLGAPIVVVAVRDHRETGPIKPPADVENDGDRGPRGFDTRREAQADNMGQAGALPPKTAPDDCEVPVRKPGSAFARNS